MCVIRGVGIITKPRGRPATDREPDSDRERGRMRWHERARALWAACPHARTPLSVQGERRGRLRVRSRAVARLASARDDVVVSPGRMRHEPDGMQGRIVVSMAAFAYA